MRDQAPGRGRLYEGEILTEKRAGQLLAKACWKLETLSGDEIKDCSTEAPTASP